MTDRKQGQLGDLLGSLSGAEGPFGALSHMLSRSRAQLSQLEVEGSAGGGVVRVMMNGERDVMAVHIDPSIMEGGGDVSMLEELLVAAIRDAAARASQASNESIARITGIDPSLLQQ